MQNIEIKCPLPERARVERRLREMGAEPRWTRRQRDTFFAVPEGWLKLREAEGVLPELIAYRRSTDTDGPRPSDYVRARLEDAELWKELLAVVLPRETVVEKERTLWRAGRTRVHLDRVRGLGEFLELETAADEVGEREARRECDELIAALELDRASFLAVPYRALLDAAGR